jgi:hypothetical protein
MMMDFNYKQFKEFCGCSQYLQANTGTISNYDITISTLIPPKLKFSCNATRSAAELQNYKLQSTWLFRTTIINQCNSCYTVSVYVQHLPFSQRIMSKNVHFWTPIHHQWSTSLASICRADQQYGTEWSRNITSCLWVTEHTSISLHQNAIQQTIQSIQHSQRKTSWRHYSNDLKTHGRITLKLMTERNAVKMRTKTGQIQDRIKWQASIIMMMNLLVP